MPLKRQDFLKNISFRSLIVFAVFSVSCANNLKQTNILKDSGHEINVPINSGSSVSKQTNSLNQLSQSGSAVKNLAKIHTIKVEGLKFQDPRIISAEKNTSLESIIAKTLKEELSLDLKFASEYHVTPEYGIQNDVQAPKSARALKSNGEYDAKLSIKLVRFDERQGSSFGTEKVAAVSFISQVSNASGVLWERRFFFQDQAFSDNLLQATERSKISSRSGWLTAEEIFEYGLREVCRNLSKDRQAQYMLKRNSPF